MAAFAAVKKIDGYLPIEDHGLIGDGTTAALVGRDGAVSWICVPRFDSAPLFCRILDVKRGGAFTVAPEGLIESRQFYEGDTGVLVTEMRSPSGVIRLTDGLSLRIKAGWMRLWSCTARSARARAPWGCFLKKSIPQAGRFLATIRRR